MLALIIIINDCSGLISQDKDAIKEAITSVRRNGVGLKGEYLLVHVILYPW